MLRVTDLKQWAYCRRIVYYQHRMPGVGKQTYKMGEGKAAQDMVEQLEMRRTLREYGFEGAGRKFGVWVPGSTLRMPALAGAEYPIPDSLTVNTAIFLVLFCGTVATWMRTLVGFLFYHDPLPCLCSAPSQIEDPLPGYATARSFFRRKSSLAQNQSTSGLPSGHPRCIQSS